MRIIERPIINCEDGFTLLSPTKRIFKTDCFFIKNVRSNLIAYYISSYKVPLKKDDNMSLLNKI